MVRLILDFLDKNNLPAEAQLRRKTISEYAARLAFDAARAAFANFPDDTIVSHHESGAPYFESESFAPSVGFADTSLEEGGNLSPDPLNIFLGARGMSQSDRGSLPHLSISHAQNAILVGISDKEIGVDIEPVAPLRESVLRRAFNLGERNYVNAEEDHDKAFAEVWTRKEALCKAEGKGLKFALTNSVCDEYGALTFIPSKDGTKKWRLKTYFEPQKGSDIIYCISVCAEDTSLPRGVLSN